MADVQRLTQALQAADAAGDTEAATALAQEIRRLQSQPEGSRVTADSLRQSNPSEYDPSSPEYRKKYGTGGAGAVLKDVGRNILRAPVTVADAALTVGRSAVAAPIAGIAGVLSAPAGFLPGMDGVGARNVERVQNFIGGQPFTERGQQVINAAAYPLEKFAQGADWAGQKATDATGSPLVGAGVNTTIQALPALLGRGVARGRVGGNVPSPTRPGRPVAAGAAEARPAVPPKAGRGGGLERVSEKAPSIDELQAAKNAAYKAAEETGVVISREGMNRLKVEIVNDLKKEGIDRDLHPAATAAVKRIVETKGQPTLSELETLRKIANDARTSNNPADARLGARIIERIDDFEDALGQADVVSGNPAAATAFKQARALNQRLAKARTVQKLFDDAELAVGANYTAAGMDTALRQQFRALAKNDRKMRGFTPEERAAIRHIVKGGKVQNAMRILGKFAPNGVVSSLAGIGAYGVAGPGGLALPAAGIVARQGAAKIGIRNANRVSELVRGKPIEKPAKVNSLAEIYQ